MRLREIKKLALKKGWAGRTISRQETAVRLGKLFDRVTALHALYNKAEGWARGNPMKPLLSRARRRLALDMGKIAETIFSCGGVARTTVNRSEPRADIVEALLQQEYALQEALQAEQRGVEHQMRTEAVVAHCLEGSTQRIALLNQCAQALRSTR